MQQAQEVPTRFPEDPAWFTPHSEETSTYVILMCCIEKQQSPYSYEDCQCQELQEGFIHYGPSIGRMICGFLLGKRSNCPEVLPVDTPDSVQRLPVSPEPFQRK